MRRILRTACVQAVVLLALVPLPAAAQIEPYLGRPIADVRLTISGQPTSDVELHNALETRAGEPLTAAQVRESIIHLMALSRFDNVEVAAQAEPRGVVLSYDVRPLRTIRSIRFSGRLGLPQDLLRTQISDRFGAAPPLSRASDIAAALVDLYRAHSFPDPKVSPRPDLQLRPDQTVLTLEIDAGVQPRIATVTYETDARVNRLELQRKLQVKEGAAYDQAEIARRVSAYTEQLRSNGFYQATIAVTSSPRADGASVTLTVTAQRGPRVLVELAGDPVPNAKLNDLVPIKRENAVDQDLIEDWAGNIETFLRREGYKDAAVSSAQRSDRGDRLAIVFTVRRGPQYVINSIAVAGNQALDKTTILGALAPLKTAVGQPLVGRSLELGVNQVVSDYRARGFQAAAVKASESTARRDATQVFVDVGLAVSEGPQTLIESVVFTGNRQIPTTDLARVIRARAGEPFVPADLDKDRQAILELYGNRGYQLAVVSLPDASETVSGDHTRAAVRFVIEEGPQILVDHVLIVGNNHTKAETIRTTLQLKPGEPLAYDKILEGQQRLAALGLFRRVQVNQLQHGSETRRDVLVIVQEAPATSVSYGGGLEGGKRQRSENGQPVEAIEIVPRVIFGISRRNLLGKNRSISFDGSFAPRPQATGLAGGELPEYRALGTYREPRVFGSRVDLVITGGVEQALRPAYSFNRRGVRAEAVRQLSSRVTWYGRYSLDRTRVINEPTSTPDQILVSRLVPGVRLSKVSSTLVRDTRDESEDPSRGTLMSIDGEIAPPLMGSEIGVVKGIGQTFIYKQLPTRRRIVFAGGVRFGVASGYGTTELRDVNGNPILDPQGKPQIVAVVSPPLSERFFAGGTTSVRGVAEDTLGTPDTLVNGFATGGGGLLLLNAELRVSVWKNIAAVTFVDAGNVYQLASKIQPGDLLPAVGAGLRYKSPIGPIRVDLGFNLRRRVLGTQREGLTAIYFGIGQAF